MSRFAAASTRSVSLRRSGFTLIEVLVVVAIIALLVSVLIPSLLSAREQAKRTECTNNLHQIGISLTTYAHDSKDQLPPLYRTATSFTTYYVRSTGLAGHPGVRAGLHNLGLLVNRRYLADPKSIYCIGQHRRDSASLTFNGPSNKWFYSDQEWLADRKQVRSSYPARLIEVLESSQQIGGGPTMKPMPSGQLTGWKLGRLTQTVLGSNPRRIVSTDLAQKVIYSDFTGVTLWSGGGVVNDEIGNIAAPHNRKGFNRLFGDASVRWAKLESVNAVPIGHGPGKAIAPRPLSTDKPDDGKTAPVNEGYEMADYYKVLDKIP